MKTCQILFAGFGGQGILFAGKFLAYKGLLAGKLEELSLILESYDTVCAAGQQDPRDRLAYLAKRLGQTDFARDKAFYLDGFSDFTGVELEILQQLLRSGAPVTLCLCCDGLERGPRDGPGAAAGGGPGRAAGVCPAGGPGAEGRNSICRPAFVFPRRCGLVRDGVVRASAAV